MNYAIAAFLILMLGLGAFTVARSPAFWLSIAKEVFAVLGPAIKQVLQMRNSPEIEEKMKQCTRMGGTWDNFNKICRFK